LYPNYKNAFRFLQQLGSLVGWVEGRNPTEQLPYVFTCYKIDPILSGLTGGHKISQPLTLIPLALPPKGRDFRFATTGVVLVEDPVFLRGA